MTKIPIKMGKLGKKTCVPLIFSSQHYIYVLPKRLIGSRKDTGFTVRWNSSLFIDSKLSAVQAPGDEWASGSACFWAFSLQYICDAGADRGFLYASFTLQTHHNSVVFQASVRIWTAAPTAFRCDSVALPRHWWITTAPAFGCNAAS